MRPPFISLLLTALGALLTFPLSPAGAVTLGHWGFDDAGAADGAAVSGAANGANPGTLDAMPGLGTPVYSSDVISAEIYDPVTDTVITNGFSLDATTPSSRLQVADDVSMNTSFTIEFFIKLGGEPASYETFMRRRQAADLLWQVDYDHAVNLVYGRARARWDTPAGVSDDLAENGIDENFNFVVGPQGGASAPRMFVDTGAKDAAGADVGPQNTGNVADYVYDAASVNPNDTDVALQGDGINDVDRWHHIAMTLDQATGEVSFFFNYQLSQRRTLADTEANGYTHPAAALEFGKFSAGGYALLIDEVRYSDTLLTPGNFLRPNSDNQAAVVGHWRMEEDDAVDGGAVTTLENEASVLHAASASSGSPLYSEDVPGSVIHDPLTDTFYTNAFSMDATGANARAAVTGDPAFDSSFTVEMFMKLGGEPGGYQTFMRRYEARDLRWQIDFDHANAGAYGRPRARWDTPEGGVSNDLNDATDENNNFVVGPTGGANVPEAQRIFIDTDAGDGLVASYDDAADWALDGDGVNDVAEWHHLAMTFDEDTGTVTFFLDGEAVQTRVLSDSEANGYTHPAANLEFGKFAGDGYGLLMDEVRLTGSVLFPEQFLQAISEPPAPFAITDVSFDSATRTFTLSWNAEIEEVYSIDRYNESLNIWEEIDDSLEADAAVMTYDDPNIPSALTRAMYRVRRGGF